METLTVSKPTVLEYVSSANTEVEKNARKKGTLAGGVWDGNDGRRVCTSLQSEEH
jgi:hypothetical protein